MRISHEEFGSLIGSLEGLKILKLLHDCGFNATTYPDHNVDYSGWGGEGPVLILLRFLQDIGVQCLSEQIFEDKKELLKGQKNMRKIAKQCGFEYSTLENYSYILVFKNLNKESKKRLLTYMNKMLRHFCTMYSRKDEIILVTDDIVYSTADDELFNFVQEILIAYNKGV